MRLAICIAMFAYEASLGGQLIAESAIAPRVLGDTSSPEVLRDRAMLSVRDMINNFWIGDVVSGYIVATRDGFAAPNGSREPRVTLWQSAMLYNALYNYFVLSQSQDVHRMLVSDWMHIKAAYSRDQLTECGADSHENYASDDTAWNALAFLEAFSITDDVEALYSASAALDCAYSRWYDDNLGGGLWYSDARKSKSLYQAALALAALELFELTSRESYLKYARSMYDWMESHLLRDDGLYWCEYSALGPVGKDRPREIKKASSVTFLAGNMGMAILHARFYRLTGASQFRDRSSRTTTAILKYLRTRDGVLVNERDAWVNGFFAEAWAREAAPLSPLFSEVVATLSATSDSIWSNARSIDGYYKGDWDSSAGGDVWRTHRTFPEQIMTSASAVNIIIAAAAVAQSYHERGRPNSPLK